LGLLECIYCNPDAISFAIDTHFSVVNCMCEKVGEAKIENMIQTFTEKLK